MLKILEKGNPEADAGDQPPSAVMLPEALGPLRETALDRLAVRRWLIVLAVALFASMSIIHGLPVWSALAASAAFVAGSAFIPRVRTLYLPHPLVLAPKSARPDALLKAVIDGVPEPVILLTREGYVLTFNAKAAETFDGLKLGWHISGAIRNPRLLDGVAAAAATAKAQTVSYADRVPVERHMAAAIGWLGSAVEARDPAIILFLRDLTEQERLDEMRADFIANASHELKTPLASLLGFIETLQGAARNDADARDRFLGIMAKQAERMARLIDNLMSLSKVEMRAHLKPQDQVNIADVVRSSVDAMEPMARDAKIELSVSSAADDAFVLGDRDELTQVFLNLIHNGIKYGRAGGRVDISIDRVSETGATARIHIAVADDGPGISPQHLPRLTERFYRVPEIGPDRAGTGLGLAIAKHVLNRHRGELRIVSKEGAGSKFTVVLAEAPNSQAHPNAPAAEGRPALAVWP